MTDEEEAEFVNEKEEIKRQRELQREAELRREIEAFRKEVERTGNACFAISFVFKLLLALTTNISVVVLEQTSEKIISTTTATIDASSDALSTTPAQSETSKKRSSGQGIVELLSGADAAAAAKDKDLFHVRAAPVVPATLNVRAAPRSGVAPVAKKRKTTALSMLGSYGDDDDDNNNNDD